MIQSKLPYSDALGKEKKMELHGCLRGSGVLKAKPSCSWCRHEMLLWEGVLRDDKQLRVIELCELSVKTASTVLGLRNLSQE